MSEDFIPRISIPDDEDAGTVALALTEYVARLATHARITGALRDMASEVKRSAELIDHLVCAVEARDAEAKFGSLPDDDTIAETLEKLAGEFRDGDTDC